MKDKNSIEQRFCGNCLWFDGDFEDEMMQFCDDKEQWCYSHWSGCYHWKKKYDEQVIE